MQSFRFLFLIYLFALTAYARPAACAEAVATVVEIEDMVLASDPQNPGGRMLSEGDAVYLGETIQTAENSSVQIQFSDESLLTLSPGTEIRIDDYLYDEQAQDGNFLVSAARGLFRLISGKIAAARPENVEIELPYGSIGIRGTIVIGEIDGQSCLVTLEAEEGEKTPRHRVVVSNKSGDTVQEVEITWPGEATRLEGPGRPPTPPAPLPVQTRMRFKQQLHAAKFLPRDESGRPRMNPAVHDPRLLHSRQNFDKTAHSAPEGPVLKAKEKSAQLKSKQEQAREEKKLRKENRKKEFNEAALKKKESVSSGEVSETKNRGGGRQAEEPSRWKKDLFKRKQASLSNPGDQTQASSSAIRERSQADRNNPKAQKIQPTLKNRSGSAPQNRASPAPSRKNAVSTKET